MYADIQSVTLCEICYCEEKWFNKQAKRPVFIRFCTLFEVWIQYQIRVKFSNDASIVARLNVFSFQSY